MQIKAIQISTFCILTPLVIALVSIVYKACTIPITHDEVATAVHYSRYSAWEIMMYPDNWPNNHILNTLLTKFNLAVFGQEKIVVRLASMLSWVLAAFGIHKILKKWIRHPLTCLAFSLFFVSFLYSLDFYSLSRGYAMSNALLIVSASSFLQGAVDTNHRRILAAIPIAMLAAYASFTALHYVLALVKMCVIYLFVFRKRGGHFWQQLLGISIGLLGYAALIYTPIKKMTSTNQFQYWTNNGFYQDTLSSLVRKYCTGYTILGVEAKTWSVIILISLLLISTYVISKLVRLGLRASLKDPLVLVFTLTFAMFCINSGQSILLDTPFLSGRTAQSYWVMYWLLMVFVFYSVQDSLAWIWLTMLQLCLLLFCIVHIQQSYRSDQVREWYYDTNNEEVLDFIQRQDSERQVVSCHWKFHPSLLYYCSTGKAKGVDLMPYSKTLVVADSIDYYYIFSNEVEQYKGKLQVVKRYEQGVLCKHNRE